MKKIIPFLVLFIFVLSCKNKNTGPAGVHSYRIELPGWIKQGNIYEVNVRQYTPEGTFKAFARHLDRLKEMGVQTLWFMPIHPISHKDRKGTLGSYYAIADYKGINPEFGSMDDWKQLVQSIHEKGMKVIIDWVPNHTGADHPWVSSQSDFYIKDSAGHPTYMYDWTDIRILDYKNQALHDSMIGAMTFWVQETGIDGFRVDVAWNIPEEFWKKCIPQLKALKKDIFMLAEGDKPYLMTSGFHAYYPWEMFHKMVQVAAGQRTALSLDSVRMKYDTVYPANAVPVYFTSNHDENSWNQSDFGTFPGPVHAPFAVFTQTMSKSMPLIYSGQEEPLLRALAFFEKDQIEFKDFKRAGFYKTLLMLRRNNPALSVEASFRKWSVGDDKALYAFTRESGRHKIFVILNLSDKDQTVKVTEKTLHGNPYNVFKETKETLTDQEWKLEPWGYVVYDFK
jgi:alpha-amylase